MSRPKGYRKIPLFSVCHCRIGWPRQSIIPLKWGGPCKIAVKGCKRRADRPFPSLLYFRRRFLRRPAVPEKFRHDGIAAMNSVFSKPSNSPASASLTPTMRQRWRQADFRSSKKTRQGKRLTVWNVNDRTTISLGAATASDSTCVGDGR